MGSMNLSINIDAKPEDVFSVIADVESAPKRIEWYEKVEIITDGPFGVGSKWQETRRMNNKQSVEEWEVTVFESPNYYSAYCDSQGYDIELTMRVEPEGNGSKLTLEMTTKPRTLIGKLMTPLELLMSSMMKKMVHKDLVSTKEYIERTYNTSLEGSKLESRLF